MSRVNNCQLPIANCRFRKIGNRQSKICNVLCLCVFAALLLFAPGSSLAQTKRIVVIKCDGLPYDVVDRYVKQRDPQSGKSVLPWIDHIF